MQNPIAFSNDSGFVYQKYYFIFHRKRTTEVKLLPFDKTYMNNTNLMFHAQIQQQKVFVFPVVSLRDRCISRNERLQKQRVNLKKLQEFQNHIQMYYTTLQVKFLNAISYEKLVL